MKRNLKKSKTKLIKFEHPLYLIGGVLVAIFVIWILVLGLINHSAQKGQSSSEPVANQQLYKSLVLADVKKAKFNSQPIKRVTDAGYKNNVHQYVFSYGVPADNLTEKGLMTLPNSPPPTSGYPVLILCHGYSAPWYYSTGKAYLSDMDFYSKNGFAVLKPDYRGQGLSIPDGQPEGAYYSTAYNTDVLSLISAIKHTNYLNKANINIWGHSMGAYIALRASVVSPDIKNAIILSGPVGTMQDLYSSYVAISDTLNPTAANIRLKELDLHGTPISNPTYWDKVSPLSYLSGTKTYYQIHVGSDDSLVPPILSAELDQALTKDKTHQYFVYPGGGHGLVPERSLIWQRSLDLLTGKSQT